MSGLRTAVDDYLSVRRALGFTLAGTERLLTQFVCFAETVCVDTITTDLALRWATLPAGRSVTWYAQRLGTIRCFARWLQVIDPGTQVPPPDLLPTQTLPAGRAVSVLRYRHHRADHRCRATGCAAGRGNDADVHRTGVHHRSATR
jgi:hypothetical protein